MFVIDVDIRSYFSASANCTSSLKTLTFFSYIEQRDPKIHDEINHINEKFNVVFSHTETIDFLNPLAPHVAYLLHKVYRYFLHKF